MNSIMKKRVCISIELDISKDSNDWMVERKEIANYIDGIISGVIIGEHLYVPNNMHKKRKVKIVENSFEVIR